MVTEAMLKQAEIDAENYCLCPEDDACLIGCFRVTAEGKCQVAVSEYQNLKTLYEAQK